MIIIIMIVIPAILTTQLMHGDDDSNDMNLLWCYAIS